MNALEAVASRCWNTYCGNNLYGLWFKYYVPVGADPEEFLTLVQRTSPPSRTDSELIHLTDDRTAILIPIVEAATEPSGV